MEKSSKWSLDEQEVLFSAMEGAPLADLVAASGDASFRVMSRIQAASALSNLLAAGLVEIAVERVANGEPTSAYATLPLEIANEVLVKDAAWQARGVFEFAGGPHLIWLGLTNKGHSEVAAGATADVSDRVARHLQDASAQRTSIQRLSVRIRKKGTRSLQ